MTLPTLNSWQAEVLRASCLVSEPVSVDPEQLWETFAGYAPEEVVMRPTSGTRTISGPFGEGTLELRIQINRIDWTLRSSAPPIFKSPSLGASQHAHVQFTETFLRWLNEFSALPIIRLAYCPTHFFQAENQSRANKLIEDFLDLRASGISDAHDVVVQLNFQKHMARAPEVLLNRIARLSAGAVQIMSISEESPVPVMIEHYLCRAELDFNTSADRDDVIPESIREYIFEELVRESQALLKDGRAR